MSYSHKVTMADNKSAKQKAQKAQMANERRRQAQIWLRRNSDKQKKPSVASGKKEAPQCQS
jgi:hypothetical protein